MDRQPDTPRNRGDHDAPHTSPVLPSEDVRTVLINEISWGAVLAGAAIALVLQMLLNMFGLGLGLSTINPASGDGTSASSLGMGAAIWFLLSGIVASFVGGIAAGRLSGKPRESTAGWHGLVAWAVTTLGIVYLLTSAVSGIVGGTLGIAGNVAQSAATAAAPTVANTAGDNSISAMEAQVGRVTGANGSEGSTVSPSSRARIARGAEHAANAASIGSVVAALGLLLGALASWFGGRRGAVDPTMTVLRNGRSGSRA